MFQGMEANGLLLTSNLVEVHEKFQTSHAAVLHLWEEGKFLHSKSKLAKNMSNKTNRGNKTKWDDEAVIKEIPLKRDGQCKYLLTSMVCHL